MSEVMCASAHDTIGHENSDAGAQSASDWLGLAATPTFAIMALLTSILGDGNMAMICSTADVSSSLGGMVRMYLLMSAFHSKPWLKLVANRRSRERRS